MAGARDVPSSRTVARAIGRRLSQTEADDQPPSSVAGGTRFISYHSSAPALRRTTTTPMSSPGCVPSADTTHVFAGLRALGG